MARRKPTKSDTTVMSPRIRVLLDDEIAIGPGKAELLTRVAETGSIAAAASDMNMSYMRAWSLLRTMNACFREPLVTTVRGGRQRGGTRLTPTGREVLSLYAAMTSKARSAARSEWTRLRRLLRSPAHQMPGTKR